MPVRPNNPLSALAIKPVYANDPTGFWTANAKANAENWNAVGVGTPEADRFVIAELVRKSIAWMKIVVRWGQVSFPASIDDSQIGAPLEDGGLGVTGNTTIIFSKSSFANNQWPRQKATLELSVRGKWKSFQVVSISEGFDDTDDAVIAILEVEDSE